jgi:hypothetical protein
MARTLYVRPDKNWALFGVVSASGVDPDHLVSWLVDGRHGFPIRFTSGSATITVTNPIGTVNLVAICHHLLDAGLSVSLSGDVSNTIVIPAYPPNSVPFNAFKEVVPVGSPASVDTLILTISGNSTDVLIGELIAGEALALDPSLLIDTAQFGVRAYVDRADSPLSGIPPYSERARSRLLSGSQYYDATQLQAILDWFDSQDAFAFPVPSLLIPDSDDPTDARLVTLAEPRYQQVATGSAPLFLVELEFVEYPRTRW